MNKYERKSVTRAALFGALVWMNLVLINSTGWAGPSPLPLDTPVGTEAFISQTLDTQLRGVGDPPEPAGLNFQDIGLPAGIEYNNIGYDPVTRYMYGVQVFGNGSDGGNMGLVRIGLDPADTNQILVQPLGWPGYPSTTTPWGADGNQYPRYDAGDVDPDSRLFFVHTQGQKVGNGCLGNPSVCTDRVRSFDLDTIWNLVPPGADPANLTPVYGVSRVFKAMQGGLALDITARVADWAYKDGKLYGGDAATGMLAVITPNANDDDPDPSDDNTHALFKRFPFDPSGVAPTLDTTVAFTTDAYGAAWFIGDILYLYKNGAENSAPAKVFKIDLQINEVTGDPNPKIIDVVENVDVVTRNDGASFMAQDQFAFQCTDGPFVIQGNDNDNDPEAWLSRVNQSDLTFTLDRIPDATADYPYRLNNLGFRSTDGLLYGWLIPPGSPPGSSVNSPDGQIVKIDKQFNVTLLGTPAGMPTSGNASNLNAGDITPDGNTMYLTNSGGYGPAGTRKLWVVDLTAFTASSFDILPSLNGRVNDFAVHPTNGYLYGCDQEGGELAILDPSNGARTDIDVAGLPGGTVPRYGAAWFNANGNLFCYENAGTIYEIQLNLDPMDPIMANPLIVSTSTGTGSTDNDGAACVAEVDPAPGIEIQKTVYRGHDSGTSTASGGELVIGENGDPVTYVFTVTNTGNTYLSSIMIDDAVLGINRSDLTLLSGSEPLAPGDSLVFFYQTAISGNLVNTAIVNGNPVDEQGEDILELDDPTDDDTAEVQEAVAGIEIQKTVYAGHNSGTSAPGGELVAGANGSEVTYIFTVRNTGETYLSDITIVDAQLGINRTDLTLLSGSEPLAPFATLVFYYEGTISGDLTNTASTSGNPVDENGADLPGFENPMNSDTARVEELVAGIEIQKTVYEGHDYGGSAPGDELVVAANGSEVTYVFIVINTGETYLSDITIDDNELGITEMNLTLSSGSEPLAPGASLVYYYETSIDGDLVNTATASGNPVDEQGVDLPGFVDPTHEDSAEVRFATGTVSVLKLTDGVVDSSKEWTFSLYNGPNDGNGSNFLASPLASASTFGDVDGVLEFNNYVLDVSMTYTLCEMNMGAGYSSQWMIDTSRDGSANMIIMPNNPNVSDNPAEDMGIRCFDFGAGTSYELIADGILVFEVNNIPPPGGEARTPGYWKNWNACSHSNGNQLATAEKNDFYLLDDILNDPGVSWGTFNIATCEEGVSILDQRDLDTGKKKAKDAAYTLAMHLLAYQLNAAAGTYYCEEAASAAVEAENLLESINFDGTGNYLRPKEAEYQMALDLAATLNAYNNNMLCK
ncbi:MAG: hypothetical protein JSV50_09490 [Desulfobacteraceae bacterium]|nr:MAG: hypothetical protein JSV50_09490 [Desulfobacteraceae bacterium]